MVVKIHDKLLSVIVIVKDKFRENDEKSISDRDQ